MYTAEERCQKTEQVLFRHFGLSFLKTLHKLNNEHIHMPKYTHTHTRAFQHTVLHKHRMGLRSYIHSDINAHPIHTHAQTEPSTNWCFFLIAFKQNAALDAEYPAKWYRCFIWFSSYFCRCIFHCNLTRNLCFLKVKPMVNIKWCYLWYAQRLLFSLYFFFLLSLQWEYTSLRMKEHHVAKSLWDGSVLDLLFVTY